jgi:Putative MetA-pathway of phenol degradation
MTRFSLTVAMTLLTASQAFAGGLFAPFALDSAQVMPKGVRSIRLGGFTTEITDKYDGGGTIVPLADSFNKQITWKELIDSTPGGFERGQFKGGLESMGVDLNSVVGDARGVVDTRLTTTLPIAAYGVTQKLTVAVAVPIIYSNLNVDTGWAANEQFQQTVNMMANEKGFYNKVLSYEDQLQNVVNTKIANLGYKPLVNDRHTDVGDVTLAAKYQVFSRPKFAVAISPRVVAPTGRTADVDKVVDVAGGDGQWDLGLSAAADYIPNGNFTLTGALGYTYQVASTRAKRLPVSEDDTLSADKDERTHEKLGDLMGASLGGRFRLHKLVTFGTGYGFQYKLKDSYSGGQYAAERYDILEDDTEQHMHSGTVGLTFSTIPLFRAKQFALPLDASVAFTRVFGGRNVGHLDLTALELVSYF